MDSNDYTVKISDSNSSDGYYKYIEDSSSLDQNKFNINGIGSGVIFPNNVFPNITTITEPTQQMPRVAAFQHLLSQLNYLEESLGISDEEFNVLKLKLLKLLKQYVFEAEINELEDGLHIEGSK